MMLISYDAKPYGFGCTILLRVSRHCLRVPGVEWIMGTFVEEICVELAAGHHNSAVIKAHFIPGLMQTSNETYFTLSRSLDLYARGMALAIRNCLIKLHSFPAAGVS